MKKYCVHCFDTEEIIHYIELNGEFGQCPVLQAEAMGGTGRMAVNRRNIN